jgi:hypothetical protein
MTSMISVLFDCSIVQSFVFYWLHDQYSTQEEAVVVWH